MPGLFTHYLCGSRMLELLENQTLRDVVIRYRQVFNLGTQGPDIFFYYRVWPWTNSHGIEKIGERMHGKKVSAFFTSAVQYIMNREGRDKNVLTAYLCGYLCHYSLDLHTHPYIFYKTGFVRPGEAPTSKYTCYHRMFETAVDVIMLDRVLAVKPIEVKAHELIRVSGKEAQTIGKMYEFILQNTYGVKVSAGQVSEAIRDMVTVQAVLRDRSGLKKKLLSWFEKSRGNFPLMASMIYPSAIIDGLDYLNLDHRPWFFPWDRSVKHTSSFPEMFEHSAQEAKEMGEALFHCLSGTGDIRNALERIGNRSFSTGIDCNRDVQFKYFNCIYEPFS